MIFNCFPRKQKGIFLVYSRYNEFKSRLFNDLVIQVSPKNSVWFRLLRTRIGFLLTSILRIKIEVPSEKHNYIGILKGNNIILFEMINDTPTYVWRKNEMSQWIKESFLGYQLLSEYTVQEFNDKSKLIEEAFKFHWESLQDNKLVHGDFTHFNILLGANNKPHFIDEKSHQNSKLFDFFYFYSYLQQCLERCKTINYVEKESILLSLGKMILQVCNYTVKTDLFNDIKAINFPKEWGLIDNDKEKYVLNFKERLAIIFNTTSCDDLI